MARDRSVACAGFAAIFIALWLAPVSETAAAASKKRSNSTCAAWSDDFTGNTINANLWAIGNGRAPGYLPGEHSGLYQPDHVAIANGQLSMLLTQEQGLVDGAFGVVSRGALLSSLIKCGYGTYQWTMRMSSTAASSSNPGVPVSGSVSAGFLYVNNSETEIDVEFSGQDTNTLHLSNWLNRRPSRDPIAADETHTALQPFDSTSGFHTYKVLWQPGRVSYFIDGLLRAEHTSNVPSAPAYFMINHWGTDSARWGGPATLGVSRYLHVDRVSYAPLGR